MPVTAVIDTNVWVSALLNPVGYPAQVLQAARASKFRILTSLPLLDELAEVLARPRLHKARNLSLTVIRNYIVEVAEVSTIVPTTGRLALCRDPDDDILLETAINGQATHIVSRDEDMTRDLDLRQQLDCYHIEIVTVNHFLNQLTGG